MTRYDIEVKVHKKTDFGSYRVKVSVLNEDVLMHVNGTLVSPPDNKNPEWSVRTPKVPYSKNRVVEFAGISPLWREYKKACIEAVQEHMHQEKLDTSEDSAIYEKSDEEFNKQMLEDIEKIGF